jgi:hypothetical protein
MARAAALLAVAVVVVTVASGVHAQSSFPPALERYFTSTLKLTDAERKTLLSGLPLAKALDADPNKEVAVFGAIWIKAPISRYIEKLKDIENFEKGGGFRVTKKVSEPATIADFAQMVLPPDDIEDLKKCRVGDCELKGSAAAIERIRKEVNFSSPDAKAQVERSLRAIAVEFVNAYRQGGNNELAVYRDRENPTFVAREFADLVATMPELSQYLPDMRRFLLEYPKPASTPTTQFIYWQEAEFGLKPTIRISHVAIQESADGAIVASKQLYASHYFWTGLELRALILDPSRGTGFWFVNVNRSRSDGLSGFTGRVIRGKVREGARSGIEGALRATRKALE